MLHFAVAVVVVAAVVIVVVVADVAIGATSDELLMSCNSECGQKRKSSFR